MMVCSVVVLLVEFPMIVVKASYKWATAADGSVDNGSLEPCPDGDG